MACFYYLSDQVLKVTPQTIQQVQYLQELVTQWRLDLWKPDIIQEIYPGRDVYVRVQFSYVQQMKENLVQQNIPFKIMIQDVQKLIDQSSASQKNTGPISLENYDYAAYHPMDEINNWMELIEKKYNNVVTKHVLGQTYEQRPIYYLKIGQPSQETKKVVFMDCGIHAREWIAPAYCQWFVREILANQSNGFICKLLRQVDFYVIPVLNVDGYVYTWTTDRLWRKNRSPQNNETCFGVDLNRNFDVHWCSVGAAKYCEDVTFCGPSAASELETQAVVKLFEQVKTNMLMYLSIHNFGKFILLPYGYKSDPSTNHHEMESAANTAIEKMKEKHNNEYIVGSSSIVLYYTSGSSADWAIDNNIKFAYTFELRDDGEFGFQLPADQIKPTCEETMTAVLSLLGHLNQSYLEPVQYLECSAVSIRSLWLYILLPFAVNIFYAISC
ncbi:carboxypeptidase O-like [Eleutherodactylus coqui]|uniref:carboxypeptidase O-like n=1 Tax=Eleutherodactylus coqui TaxID=57060 RepID=UPI00346258F9